MIESQLKLLFATEKRLFCLKKKQMKFRNKEERQSKNLYK